MSADLLSRLSGVVKRGDSRWAARCPAHEDRSPSLSVRELPDGRTLLHCFAGCSSESVLAAVGLTFDDLFPESLGEFRRERVPFPPADALRSLHDEALIVQQVGAQIRRKEAPDMERLSVAIGRITAAMTLSGVTR